MLFIRSSVLFKPIQRILPRLWCFWITKRFLSISFIFCWINFNFFSFLFYFSFFSMLSLSPSFFFFFVPRRSHNRLATRATIRMLHWNHYWNKAKWNKKGWKKEGVCGINAMGKFLARKRSSLKTIPTRVRHTDGRPRKSFVKYSFHL